MSRPWFIWLLSLFCAAGIFGAMGVITHRSLSVEQEGAQARADAELQERLRLALWRMETEASALMIEENNRPPEHFYPAAQGQGQSQPTPLATGLPKHVRLHFDIGMDGTVISPQVPLSSAGDARYEAASQSLQQLRSLLSRSPSVSWCSSVVQPMAATPSQWQLLQNPGTKDTTTAAADQKGPPLTSQIAPAKSAALQAKQKKEGQTLAQQIPPKGGWDNNVFLSSAAMNKGPFEQDLVVSNGLINDALQSGNTFKGQTQVPAAAAEAAKQQVYNTVEANRRAQVYMKNAEGKLYLEGSPPAPSSSSSLSTTPVIKGEAKVATVKPKAASPSSLKKEKERLAALEREKEKISEKEKYDDKPMDKAKAAASTASSSLAASPRSAPSRSQPQSRSGADDNAGGGTAVTDGDTGKEIAQPVTGLAMSGGGVIQNGIIISGNLATTGNVNITGADMGAGTGTADPASPSAVTAPSAMAAPVPAPPLPAAAAPASNGTGTLALAPAHLRMTPFRPFWLETELFLVREVVAEAGRRHVQGVWLDAASLRASLLDAISDILPRASLQAVANVSFVPLATGQLIPSPAPGFGDPMDLVGLPWRLVPGEAPLALVQGWTPMRLTLAAAWIGAALAACAAAALLLGVTRLSERRAAFVSSVTHELRTPLTTFRLYSELLEQGMVREEADRSQYLHTLRTEAERLTHLVDNVLAYSRIERANRRSRMERLPLIPWIERVRPRLEDRAREAGMRLEISLPENEADLASITDATALEQIVFNLVDNACKYAAGRCADPVVHVTLERRGRSAALRVCDSGPGIARRERSRLFRPFHKSADEAANSKPGVGLGLALCHRLAKALGGKLTLEKPEAQTGVTGATSTAAATAPPSPTGACFVLRLPLA